MVGPSRVNHAKLLVAYSGGKLKELEELGTKVPGGNGANYGPYAIPLAHCIIGNLCSALEYCAHEVQRQFCPGAEANSHFPVATDQDSYRSQVERAFPGLNDTERGRQIASSVRAAQPIDNEGQRWLKVLRDLWNQSKHIDIAAPNTHTLLMKFETPGKPTEFTMRQWLVYEDRGTSDKSLTELLQTCVSGVGRIITQLEPLLEVPSGAPGPASETKGA